jgi:hypothetical protein
MYAQGDRRPILSNAFASDRNGPRDCNPSPGVSGAAFLPNSDSPNWGQRTHQAITSCGIDFAVPRKKEKRRTKQSLCHAVRDKPVTARHRCGMYDKSWGLVLDWSLGLTLDSRMHHAGATHLYGYGRHSSPRTFGHSGFRTTTAFCDPDCGLVVACS